MNECPKCGDYHPNCDALGYCPAEVSDYADKIMTEIDADITSGRVPAAVASFSELHDHVDANEYALQVIPETAAPNWDAWMELANAVEAEVTERLRARQS